MRKLFFTLLFILSISFLSHAQQRPAQELVKALYPTETLNKMVDGFKVYFQQIGKQTYNTQNDSMYNNYMNFCMEKCRNIVQKMVTDDLPTVYENNFTKEEITELVKFYKTPVGKKYVEKTPDIQKEVQELMVNKYMPVLIDDLRKYAEEHR